MLILGCLAIICIAVLVPRREHFSSSAMNIVIVNDVESSHAVPDDILNDKNTVVLNKSTKPTGAPIEFFVGDPYATVDDMKLMASHVVPEIKKISVY